MALSFPSNPTIGEQYTAPNGFTYTWNGTTWTASGSSGGGGGSGGSGGSGGAGVIYNNSVLVTATATSLNFVGSFVTATLTATAVSILFSQPPVATTSTLGTIKVGSTLNIDENGYLNAESLEYWTEFTTYINSTTSISGLVPYSSSANVDVQIYPLGNGAHIGGNSGNQRGAYATDWQKQTGSNPNNVASGAYSIIGGGALNQATNTHSIVVGGDQNVANASYGTVIGGAFGTTNNITGATIIPGFATGGAYSAPGGVQAGVYTFGGQTQDSSYHVLTTDGTFVPTANNQLVLKDNSSIHFRGMVVAKQFQTYRGEVWSWTFEGTIRRDVGSTTTDFIPSAIAPVVNLVQGINTSSNWNVDLDIDNGNGGLKILVQGNSSETIRWACRLDTIEVFDAV